MPTQRNPEYTLSKRVLITLTPVDTDKKIAGILQKISQPLSSVAIKSSQALAVGCRVKFECFVDQVALLAGSAQVLSCEQESDGEEWDIGVELGQFVKPLRGGLTERFSALVDPQLRPQYLEASEEPVPGPYEGLTPWIETSSRLYLMVDLLADINSTMETDDLLLSIMEAAQIIMESEASSLMLIDESTGELVISIPTGPARNELSGVRIPGRSGFGGWVVEHGQPLVVEDAAEDPRFFGEVASRSFRTKDLLCVPLRSPRGEVIGVLQAINKKGGTPFSTSDIPLLTSLADQAAIAIEKDRLIRESIQKQVLERELGLASEIQKGFWPKQAPVVAGIEIWGVSTPAAHVGGDYYDFIRIDDAHLGLVVADVSGKGVAAALLMAALRASLRTQVENHHSVGESVSLVNNALVGDTPREKFVTLFFGVLDTRTRILTYVNAGHNPPILYHHPTGQSKTLPPGGPIIGFRPDLTFKSGTEQLQEGHRLILYSDGITEAQNRGESFYGEERLLQTVTAGSALSAREMSRKILSDVDQFTLGHPQFDDMTLVVVSID